MVNVEKAYLLLGRRGLSTKEKSILVYAKKITLYVTLKLMN